MKRLLTEVRAGFRSPQQRCGTHRPATVGGHYTHLTLRVSIPREKHWLQPNFPALLLNSSPPFLPTKWQHLDLFSGRKDSLIVYPTSFHTPVLILRSESSRLEWNLISSCAFSETHNKSPFYLKSLVLTNQNQLGFQTVIAMDSQNPHKSKMSLLSWTCGGR